MERKSMSKIIIFTVDGEASLIFVLHLEIWVKALWSQVDWNNCGGFDPSTHTHYKTQESALTPCKTLGHYSGVSRVWQAWHVPWAQLSGRRKNCLEQ